MLKFEFKGTSGPWYSLEYAGTIQLQDGPFYGDDNILDMDNRDRDEVEANAKAIQETPEMFNLLAEIVHGLDDKEKLTLWEQSVKHSAETILERITNQ